VQQWLSNELKWVCRMADCDIVAHLQMCSSLDSGPMSCPIRGPDRFVIKSSLFLIFGSRSHRSIDLGIYSSEDLSHSAVDLSQSV
jgi:hypothetical protein